MQPRQGLEQKPAHKAARKQERLAMQNELRSNVIRNLPKNVTY